MIVIQVAVCTLDCGQQARQSIARNASSGPSHKHTSTYKNGTNRIGNSLQKPRMMVSVSTPTKSGDSTPVPHRTRVRFLLLLQQLSACSRNVGVIFLRGAAYHQARRASPPRSIHSPNHRSCPSPYSGQTMRDRAPRHHWSRTGVQQKKCILLPRM